MQAAQVEPRLLHDQKRHSTASPASRKPRSAILVGPGGKTAVLTQLSQGRSDENEFLDHGSPVSRGDRAPRESSRLRTPTT